MSKIPYQCQARRYADQMICPACGLNWDTNDPEPPQCHKIDRRSKVVKAVVKFYENVRPKFQKPPAVLPDDLAAEMDKVYRANLGGLAGMKAAYRVFLDRVEL